MLAHVSLGVRNFARSRAFYDACLKPLGYARVYDLPDACGYGLPEEPRFWIGAERGAKPAKGSHIAFAAPDRRSVRAFHRAALEGGGADNGKPGLRPHYHPDYYAAFVIDPDGHRIEALTFSRK
jgi:catechol 2,3-dioxygenase-like lactoylglutathione lyase family enzyme